MKCQILFSVKNNVNLLSADYACRVVNVKPGLFMLNKPYFL